MYPLVVVGFGYFLVPLLSARRRRRFCRRLLLRVLGLIAGSSFFWCYFAYSTYAGGSCDSNALSCDRYNTQLRVGLIAFLPFDSLA